MMMLSKLRRLSAKSLGRYNPNFAKIQSHHFSQSPKKLSVQTHPLKCPILGIDPSKKMPIELLEVFLESCNGLVCMGRPSLSKEMVLWNPCTDLWKNLPHSNSDFGGAEITSLGLGCNAEGDDFKVVRMFSGNYLGDGVEVYSSKLDSWRKMEVGFDFKSLHPKNAAVVNGNPYWMVSLRDGNAYLLKFDATETAFTELMPLPRMEDLGDDPVSTFVDWKGSIAVLVLDTKDGGWLEWIDVWVYDEGVERWRRVARFGPINLEMARLMDCSKTGKIIGCCMNDDRLFVYDPEREKGSCVVVSEFKRPSGCSMLVFPYEESVAFVEGMVPAGTEKRVIYDKFNEIDGFFVATFHRTTREFSCYYPLMGSSCDEDRESLHVEVDGIVV